MNPDIRAAIDQFVAVAPGVKEIVLWGLCDGASAAILYGSSDPRVVGLVLVNPWVRTDTLEARARLSGYYGARIREPEFWRALLLGRIGIAAAAGALNTAVRALKRTPSARDRWDVQPSSNLPDRMAAALECFRGRMLIISCEKDLTAAEFAHLCVDNERWRRLISRPEVTKFALPDANHTFSRREWRDAIAEATDSWLRSLSGEPR